MCSPVAAEPAGHAPPPAREIRIALTDALIVGNRQAFKIRVLEAIERGESRVLLDVADCPYIDASGLGVLVSLSKKCRAAGGELVLERVHDDLKLLLELSHIDTVLTVR